MILFKKWAQHKVKSCIYCVNQFFCEKRHKKWSQECKQKQSLLFIFCNIFDLLISRTEKIAWWPPVFKSDFYIFSYNEQLRKIYRNFISTFLLYHTSLITFALYIICIKIDELSLWQRRVLYLISSQQRTAPDPKCKLNISSFFTLPHPLDCFISVKDIRIIVLSLQLIGERKVRGGSFI